MTAHTFSLLLTVWLLRDVCLCFVGVFIFLKYHIILELKANFTVRRHILLFFYYFVNWIMRKEKGGKRGMKRMDEREKESEEQERIEVAEGGIERREEEEIEERPEAIKEAVEEEERCEEDIECHSSAKRARVCATFTDSQEISIVEFVKQHPELHDKEHPRFHDRNRREALWAEISAELKLQPFDVRRCWFESQRTHYGKLSKLQSGQAPREMTKRQSWVYQQMGFLKTHIRRKGANRSSGFEASPNTNKQDESRGSTTDTEHLQSSVLRERSNSILTSTPFQQTPRFSSTLTR